MILLIFIKTENRRWFPEPEGRGDEELSFNGYRVSVWEDEKFLEVDSSDVAQQCKCT